MLLTPPLEHHGVLSLCSSAKRATDLFLAGALRQLPFERQRIVGTVLSCQRRLFSIAEIVSTEISWTLLWRPPASVSRRCWDTAYPGAAPSSSFWLKQHTASQWCVAIIN